jgi:hypothetical protein
LVGAELLERARWVLSGWWARCIKNLRFLSLSDLLCSSSIKMDLFINVLKSR